MLTFFLSFFIFMIIKIPIGFAMLCSSCLYMLANQESMMIMVQRVLAAPNSFTMLAVGFFILTGNLMNTGGITSRIFDFAQKLVGHLTGGIGHAIVVASIIFSGMSGSAVAEAGGLGLIELKAMKDNGYDEDFSLALTASSSIIGPIIPPSVPAVIFGVASGVSIGRLFLGGVVPGLLMGLTLSIMVYLFAKKHKYPRPPRPALSEMWKSFCNAFLPLMTPIIIIGGMMFSIFTPTEASVVAVVYALILGLLSRELTFSDIPDILAESIEATVSILFMVGCSNIFGWVIATTQMAQALASWFSTYISSPIVALLLINLFLVILGCFMETLSALVILVPILMPIITPLNIDPVHFGIVVILNLMIGLMTPPVGMVLYVLSNISGVPFERIGKACIPFIGVMFLLLLVITLCPPLSTALPNLFFNT
ncbi:MAG: TRAP transporter large permease [Eubacteriales bacterium]|jgi:tripartite ATP-independent transporter DctM subunit